MTKSFDDWYRHEGYGDREQLERCWASAQNANTTPVPAGQEWATMRDALMNIFDYCDGSIQKIRAIAYNALPVATTTSPKSSDHEVRVGSANKER